jgi:hypothetical protein
MAVGDSALYSGESYLAVGRETAFGTYVTATAGLDFISESIKTMKDAKILEEVQRKRTMQRDFRMGKTVAGDVEFYAYPELPAVGYFLQNAFGGTVTSATATGETTGGAAFTHTFSEGSMDQTYPSLCFNVRKGPLTGGKTFRYVGAKVNSLSLAAELDEPVVITASMIIKDSTQVADDVETLLTSTALEPLSFANGRFSVENSFSSLTSSSYWHVQSINWTLNNNLKNDATARRIGSDTLALIPIGVQGYELTCQVRFNTTTAYDAMLNSTELAGEFEFLGSTLSGSSIRRGLKVQFQKLTIKDAGDPEISGPDEVLTSTITFNVLRSAGASGYAVRALLTNTQSSYA